MEVFGWRLLKGYADAKRVSIVARDRKLVSHKLIKNGTIVDIPHP